MKTRILLSAMALGLAVAASAQDAPAKQAITMVPFKTTADSYQAGTTPFYNSLDAFMNDQPNQFVFRCTDPSITEGNLLWTPVIKAGQFGLYAQDKFEVTNNLQLTYGLRLDLPVMFTNPTANVAFNQYAYQVTQGAGARRIDSRVGEMPSTKVMLSPRFGFRWFTNDSHKTLIRGGVGLFTGRVPFVWLSNEFSNTGVEIIGTTINNAADIPAVTGNTQELVDYLSKGSAFRPDIVTVRKSFRYPQVLRANLALEQRLPGDVKFTLEALYSKTYNQVFFQNLALYGDQNVYAVAGSEASAAPFYSVDNKYYSIIETRNTDKGYSYNLSATLEKNFDFGLDLLASYTFGHSKSVNDGTSSVAYSNWKYNYAIDSTRPELSYSTFDQPHRILVTAGYTTPKYANGWLQTNIAVTYNGYSGQRYSLTYNESADFNGDGYRGNSLMYIPTKEEVGLMEFVDVTGKVDGQTVVTQSAAAQRELLEAFIAGDSYAKNHRGQYAPRNSNLAPFEHQIDLHLAQSIFFLKERGSKVMITFDVLNFANMLNKKWGASWGGTYNVTPLTVNSMKKSTANGVYTPVYRWNGYTEPNKANIASRWHAQLGVKVVF